MLKKFLCKTFNLILKQDLISEMTQIYYRALDEQATLKREWKGGRLPEWSYYKLFWRIEGRLSALRELIKLWE